MIIPVDKDSPVLLLVLGANGVGNMMMKKPTECKLCGSMQLLFVNRDGSTRCSVCDVKYQLGGTAIKWPTPGGQLPDIDLDPMRPVEVDPDPLPKQERMKDMHSPLPYWTPPPPSFKKRRVKKPKTRGRR